MTDQQVKRYEDVPAIRLCSRAALDEFLSRYWPELLRQINDFSRTDAARVEAERKVAEWERDLASYREQWNAVAVENQRLAARVAELERLMDGNLYVPFESLSKALAQVASLQSRLAEVERNAARYRYLREPGNCILYAAVREDGWSIGERRDMAHVRFGSPAQLDAAIDAALSAASVEGK